jgi:cell division protein FtsB
MSESASRQGSSGAQTGVQQNDSQGIANVSESVAPGNLQNGSQQIELEARVRLLELHVQEHCERVQEQILFNRKLQETIAELQRQLKAAQATIEMLSTRACL